LEDRDLKAAIIELTMAQRQTSENLDGLRAEFKEIVKAVSHMSAMDEKLSSAHRRIDELKKDTKEDVAALDGKFMKWIWTVISLMAAAIGAMFSLNKG
jgi:phosphoglycerate-specific signal transduction histidine kinase